MNSYGFAMTYAPLSRVNSNSYKNFVTLNYDSIELKNNPTCEPTEMIVYPSPMPPKQVTNCSCICKTERNSDNTIFIVVTSISSSLCVVFFLILIWYRFIFKKKLFKWKTNESNLEFGI
jgi:hypothetical protein